MRHDTREAIKLVLSHDAPVFNTKLKLVETGKKASCFISVNDAKNDLKKSEEEKWLNILN